MALRALATSASGITPGTTPVSGGTDTAVFYQSGGVITNSANLTYASTILTSANGFNTGSGAVNQYSIAGTSWVTRPGVGSTIAYASGGYFDKHDFYNAGTLTFSITTLGVKLYPVALAALGAAAAGNDGTLAYVNDLLSLVNGTTAASGGALKGIVKSNGTNWIVLG